MAKSSQMRSGGALPSRSEPSFSSTAVTIPFSTRHTKHCGWEGLLMAMSVKKIKQTTPGCLLCLQTLWMLESCHRSTASSVNVIKYLQSTAKILHCSLLPLWLITLTCNFSLASEMPGKVDSDKGSTSSTYGTRNRVLLICLTLFDVCQRFCGVHLSGGQWRTD